MPRRRFVPTQMGSSQISSIGISVSPPTNLVIGTSQQFTATVVNTSDTSVVWKVNGIVGGNATIGTITAGGVYTAPAVVPNPATVTITATSNADNTKVAGTTVTIITSSGAPVVISISPPITVALQSTQQFNATVLNTGNLNVTWQVNGITGGNATIGTISVSGLYTAPAAVPSPSSVTITAISQADPSKSAGSTVTIVTADVQIFTANGTWTKPAGAKSVQVQLISSGGGGAGAGVDNAVCD